MKKYLLTLAISIIGFIGFSSAGSVVYTDGVPSPSSIYYVGSIDCDNIGGSYECKIPIDNVTSNLSYYISRVLMNGETEIAYGIGNSCRNTCSYIDIDEQDNSDLVNGNFDYLLLEFGEVSGENGTFTISSNNLKNSLSNGSDNSGTLLPDGTNTFTPVINRMVEIAGEFIPYIVYIFIGALGVSLLWKAVKYILGYLKGKSERTFLENEERDYHNIKNAKDYNTRKIKYKRYEDTEDYETRDKRHKDR